MGSVTHSDPDGDDTEVIKTAGPSQFTMFNNGTWEFDTAIAPGNYLCQYRSRDEFGAQSSIKGFTVEITPGNQSPVFVQEEDRSFDHNQGIKTFQLQASDPDGDPLTYEKQIGPSWATVNAQTGLVSVDTSVSRQTAAFSWVVRDGNGGFDSTSHDISIINNEPVFDPLEDKQFDHNSGVHQFQLVAEDDDDDTLTFSITDGPVGIACQPNGLVSVDTDALSRQGYSVTYEVFDGEGGLDTVTHTVTIQNNAPVLTNPGNQSYITGTSERTLQLEAVDADDDPITFNKVSGESWGTVNALGEITFDTDAVLPDTYPFEFEVTDGQGGSDSVTFNVMINPTLELPEFMVIT